MSKPWIIEKKSFGSVLTLLHEWSLDDANQFLGFLESQFVPKDHKNFIFDLHKVDHINSMVIGILISTAKRIKKEGGDIFLLQPSKSVEKLLVEIGLWSFFSVQYSEEKIIQALTPGAGDG